MDRRQQRLGRFMRSKPVGWVYGCARRPSQGILRLDLLFNFKAWKPRCFSWTGAPWLALGRLALEGREIHSGRKNPARDEKVVRGKAARSGPSGRRSRAARLDDWSPDLLKSRVYGQLLVDIILGALRVTRRTARRAGPRRPLRGCGLAKDPRGAHAACKLEAAWCSAVRASAPASRPLDLLEAREAFEARKLLETHCAGLAARHATPHEIDVINSAFDNADEAVAKNDVRALVAMDQAFHVAVASASHNRTLAEDGGDAASPGGALLALRDGRRRPPMAAPTRSRATALWRTRSKAAIPARAGTR